MSGKNLQVLECCFIWLPFLEERQAVLAELKTTMIIQLHKIDMISDGTGQNGIESF